MNHRLHRLRRLHRLGMAGLLALVLVLVLSPSPAEETTGTVTVIKAAQANVNPYQKLYEEMLYPCVRITTPEGRGSGVVIETTHSFHSVQADFSAKPPYGTDDTDKTYILSAAHVVGKYDKVQVEFFHSRQGGTESAEAEVVITDTVKDLALLTVNKPYPYVAKLAPRDYVPYLFTPVWTVGCSLGLPPRPSSGHLSALCDSAVNNYWEVSSPILPGNSGGPVFDAKTYQVIGIAVWVKVYNGQLITTMAGIVPIQTVYEFLESVEFRELPNSKNSINPTNSSPRSVGLTRCLLISAHQEELDRRGELMAREGVSTMPNVLFDVKLEIPASYAPAGDIAEKWAKNLGENADLVIDRLQRVIPDEASYQEKVSTPAAEQWPAFMSDTYRTKKGRVKQSVVKTFAKNIQDAYDNWVKRITRVFEEIGGVKAKRFKDAVTDSKERVTEAWRKKGLRITGDRIHGIGAAAIACFWMTGEPTIAGKLRDGDQVTAGAPYRICREEFVQSFRAALMSRLIQAGMLISNTEYQPGAISAQNTITNNLVQGFVDPALGLMAFTPGGGSCVDFLLEDGIFKLQIQATQT